MMPPRVPLPEEEAFRREFEAYCADRSPDRNYRALLSSIGVFAKVRPTLSLAGPAMAVLWWVIIEHAYPWHITGLCRLTRTFLQKILWRNRPLWNDFHMCLWQLSREEWAISDLYWHLSNANRNGISTQAFTGDWMVSSVRLQDPDFALYWDRLVAKNGTWNATPPGAFAAALGNDSAILERVNQLHPRG
jgi:hypothetical protein